MVTPHATYEAKRAAALAGVPERTIYHWAQMGIWQPALSQRRHMRWSYSDLLGLRLIDWLRKEKSDYELPSTSMGKIKQLLASVDELSERLIADRIEVWVDQKGSLVVKMGEEVSRPLGEQGLLPMMDLGPVDLVRAYGIAPDLREPRETLRIVPGKVSGEPHVVDTRMQTSGIYALRVERHLDDANILDLYPFLTGQNVREAIDLEEQLAGVIRPAA